MDDPSFWKDAAKFLWLLLVPLVRHFWIKHEERLEKLENGMSAQASQKSVDELGEAVHSLRNRVVSKEDFKAHEERDLQDRNERRQAEAKIFDKIDDIRDDMTGRFDNLKDLILQRVK